MVFIAYKLRAETLKGWLLDDTGKECRSHCQSPVGEMKSFKHKMQGFGAKVGENP